jgi:3-methyladenine DNA glycosylase/8-oxoguanine DNA glycosylase
MSIAGNAPDPRDTLSRVTNDVAVAAERPAAVDVVVAIAGPYSLARTLSTHRRGSGDPSHRLEQSGAVWRATRTASGPATLFMQPAPDGVRVRAWGPGAVTAIAAAPALLGVLDDPSALVPQHRAVAEGARRASGTRIGRSGALYEALVPAILEQKITGDEAHRTYRAIVRAYGEDAPGPPGLRLFPGPETLAAVPYHAFHPLGLERRRAELIRAVSREAARLERLGAAVLEASPGPGRDAALAAAYAALRTFPGIGPWTAAEVGFRAFGDADALSVGDFHIPNMVCWALAGEPRGTDERMLELLEPYRGQRARVTRYLELGGFAAPRYGPRLSSRDISRY